MADEIIMAIQILYSTEGVLINECSSVFCDDERAEAEAEAADIVFPDAEDAATPLCCFGLVTVKNTGNTTARTITARATMTGSTRKRGECFVLMPAAWSSSLDSSFTAVGRRGDELLADGA